MSNPRPDPKYDQTKLPPYKGLSATDTLGLVVYAVVGTLWWFVRGCAKP